MNSLVLNPTNVNIQILIRQEKCLRVLVGSFIRGMSVSEPALSDMETIVNPNDKYDYTSYITQDSKTLLGCSKLLLISTFLMRLIDRYSAPTYKSQSGAQTEFENNERH